MEPLTINKICVKIQTQNNVVYNVLCHKHAGKSLSCSLQRSRGETHITFQKLCTTRFGYMRKYLLFLHLVHMNTHNSMNDKQPSLHLIFYVHAQTYYTKNLPDAHHTPYTHLHKCLLDTHHATIYPCTILHMKILELWSFTHAIKLSTTYKLTKATSQFY